MPEKRILKILVADDESHILHVVSLKLRNAGFEVLTAADGREALELAIAEMPDLLITDYQCPKLSGLELCQKLKQDPRPRRFPPLCSRRADISWNPRIPNKAEFYGCSASRSVRGTC